MTRVRTRVSTISRRHPSAGFRLTSNGEDGSQVRQYRSSAGAARGAAQGRGVRLGLGFGFVVGFADGFGLLDGEADGPAVGVPSSGWAEVGSTPNESAGQ